VDLDAHLEGLLRGDESAVDALCVLGPEAVAAVPTLKDVVAKGKPPARLAALQVLAAIGAGARAAMPELLHALGQGDGEVRTLAADALAALGPDAVGPLLGELDDDDAKVRQASARALGTIAGAARAAVPALLARALDPSEEEEVALRAIWALGEIGDPSMLAPLATLFTERGGTVGVWIAEACAKVGRGARPVADAFRAELHRDDAWLALAAAHALIRIGEHVDAAVWALVACLQRAEADVRLEAALSLGEIGPKAAAALPALKAAERDDDEEIRAQATLAIAKIRPEAVLRPRGPSPAARAMGPKGPEAFDG